MTTEAPVEPLRSPLETALYLESGRETVFALRTSPACAEGDLGVVLAHSGANNFSAHRNGVWTSISRRLAREGIPSLRFDFAGTGESSGEFVLGLGGQPVIDTTAAMDALRQAGCRRLLLVGSCFGAIPSLAAGAGRDDVAGVILLSPPLVLAGSGQIASIRERLREIVNLGTLRAVAADRELRRWFFARLASLAGTRARVALRRLGTRTPPRAGGERDAITAPARGLLMEAELARLVASGRHVEVVFGTSDANLARVDGDPAASRALGLLQQRRPAGLVRSLLEGPVHGLEDVAVQQELIRLVVDRARELAVGSARAAG